MNVAGTHPGCRGHHQRLKGRDGARIVGFLPHNPNGFAEHPELDKACPDGKVNTRRQQQDHQNVRVQVVIEG